MCSVRSERFHPLPPLFYLSICYKVVPPFFFFDRYLFLLDRFSEYSFAHPHRWWINAFYARSPEHCVRPFTLWRFWKDHRATDVAHSDSSGFFFCPPPRNLFVAFKSSSQGTTTGVPLFGNINIPPDLRSSTAIDFFGFPLSFFVGHQRISCSRQRPNEGAIAFADRRSFLRNWA